VHILCLLWTLVRNQTPLVLRQGETLRCNCGDQSLVKSNPLCLWMHTVFWAFEPNGVSKTTSSKSRTEKLKDCTQDAPILDSGCTYNHLGLHPQWLHVASSRSLNQLRDLSLSAITYTSLLCWQCTHVHSVPCAHTHACRWYRKKPAACT